MRIPRNLILALLATALALAALASAASARSVVISSGDTLSGLAARHGVSTSALASANGIANSNAIVAGQRLRLPGGAPAAGGGGGASGAPVAVVSRSGVRGLLDAAAARHGMPADLVRAIAWQESGWSHSARSGVGALGVMQLMPATASWVGRDVLGRRIDRSRVDDNVDAGVAYLAWLRRHMGSDRLAIAAYYQGQGSVRAIGLLGETERYVASVASLRGRV